MVFITSYDRPKMLLRLLKELEGEAVTVIDDGSTYDPSEHLKYCDYYRVSHKGKEGFWSNWNFMLQLAKESNDNFFAFLADDWHDVWLDQAKEIHKTFTDAYTFNFPNNGRMKCWTPFEPYEIEDPIPAYRVGFVDCGYFCNRKALEVLKFKQDPIPVSRFRTKGISSGVGQTQSWKYLKAEVPMHVPKVSLVSNHGDYESKMNPIERKKNPNRTNR